MQENIKTETNQNSNIPIVGPGPINQFTNVNNDKHSSFQLSEKDKAKLPNKRWIHWALIIIPVCLIVSISVLTYALITSERPINFPSSFTNKTSPTPSTPPNLIESDHLTLDSDSIQQAWQINNMAQETDTLTLQNCKPDPFVAQITQGKIITITNKDNSAITLLLNKNKTYEVGANGKLEVNADFGRGPAAYGYSCNNSPKAVGYILITQ